MCPETTEGLFSQKFVFKTKKRVSESEILEKLDFALSKMQQCFIL